MDRTQSTQRDFGSFHASNVQELISTPEDRYQAPSLPIQLPAFTNTATFGAGMKEKHFFLDTSWTFLNHGAFGSVIKEALYASQSWQVYCERQPLRFLDRELLPHLVNVTRRLAKFVDADPSDVVLIPNATTGINTVVRSVVKTFKPESSILTLNLAYGATKKLLKQINEELNIRIDEVTVTFPLKSAEEVITLIQRSISADTALAIFDHIPSNYGIILPIKELVATCHQRGVQVLVDGAHALGMLPISMKQINADYYISNAHKWLGCPKGCAFMYVQKPHQQTIRPLVISHGFGSGFNSEFIWTGLRDYSPFLALHTVLDFWEHYGVSNIRRYIYDTARVAAEMLQNAWGTGLLADLSLFGSMVLVALPDGVLQSSPPYTYDAAERVQNALFHEFKIEVPIKAIQGKLYVRISSHIYNEAEEYAQLAEAILKLAGRTDNLTN